MDFGLYLSVRIPYIHKTTKQAPAEPTNQIPIGSLIRVAYSQVYLDQLLSWKTTRTIVRR